MSVDVAVVGAGVIGSSIAYHLAARGAAVTVYDRAKPVRWPAASWGSAGGVRQQRRDQREWPLALAASRRWPGLDAELGAPTGFRQGGHLHVVERAVDVGPLRDRAARERRAGLDVEIVDGERVRALAPGLTERAVAASWSPSDGQAEPRATTRAFAAAGARHGVRFAERRIDELLVETGRVVGVLAAGEPMRAGTVVLAAGSWSRGLAETLGLRLPLQPAPLQMMLTARHDADLAPTVTAEGRRLSLKQTADGGLLVGGGWPGRFDAGRHTVGVLPESVAGSRETASAVFPPLARLPVVAVWHGIEAQSEDGVPLVGPCRVPGLFLATGFSGHGFQLSPALGAAVAAALRGEPAGALEPLSPARFASLA
jgi:sarcosine oxidase subunit beta